MINASDSFSVVAARRNPTAYWLMFTVIAIGVFVINYGTRPYKYADFDTYVFYLDSLVHFPPDNWYYFEVLSNVYLLSLKWLTRSVEGAVTLGHYLLGGIFLVFLVRSAPPSRTSWPVLLVIFAILGPLLAFVTLRATPAYFLVTISVAYAARRNKQVWLYLVGAALFHVSALLALPPLALLFFENRLGRISRIMRSRRWPVMFVIGLAVLGTLFASFANFAFSALQSIPILSKYTAYADIGNGNLTNSINHYIFLVFVSVLTIAYFLLSDNQGGNINSYIVLSYGIYIFLFFATSPVAAFRQTPFWLLPLIISFPWRKVGIGRATTPLFVTACTGLFYFQFVQVYY